MGNAKKQIKQADRDNERRILDKVTNKWRVAYYPTSDTCLVDAFVVKDGRVVGLMEVKARRSYDSNTMGDCYIACSKIDRAIDVARELDLIFTLLIKDSNGRIFAFSSPNTALFHKRQFKRERDGEIAEPVYCIPTHLLLQRIIFTGDRKK